MAAIWLAVLGPLQLTIDGEEVPVGGGKQQTLLALLGLHANSQVSVDVCLEAMWGPELPEGARHSLHTYLSNLRGLLQKGNVSLDRGAGGYRLRIDPEAVDWMQFERLLDRARRLLDREPEAAAALLGEALDLWRGEPLGELGSAPWAQAALARLNQHRLDAVIARIDAELALGRERELIGELEGLIVDHPLQESLWARLMTALYRAGRQADALAAYQRARTALGEELGIEPGPELAALEEQILLQDPQLVGTDRAEIRLPSSRSKLIGREADLRHLAELLEKSRLITLTGPGGIGKTTLATEFARRAGEEFEGVWFVDLTEVRSAPEVSPAVARSVGIQLSHPERAADHLAGWIGTRRVLVVIDNCEHVLAAVRPPR